MLIVHFGRGNHPEGTGKPGLHQSGSLQLNRKDLIDFLTPASGKNCNPAPAALG